MKTNLFTETVKSHFNLECVTEFKFDPVRRWRADYFIPDLNMIIEVEGGAFIRGRHTMGVGFINDMEKYNAATLAGYQVFRVTPDTLFSTGIELIRKTIEKL